MAEGRSKVSEEDIIEALKQFNVPVGRNDLKTPTKEFVIKVFESFLNHLQISVIELKTWETTDHFEDPDIYEEMQYLILLAMIINQIFDQSNLNVTIRDIVEPKPKRTKKILHFILVFWKYFLKKYSCFCAIEKLYENDRKKAEDIVLENQSLDAKYEEKLNVLQTVLPTKDDLKAIVEERQKELNNKSTQKENIELDYHALKAKESKLLGEINSTDIKIASSKEKLEELNQLILSSPDRMTKDIQRLKDKIKIEDINIKEKENDVRDAEKRVESQERYIMNSEKVFASLNDLKKHQQSLGETVKSLLSNQQKIEEEKEKLNKLQRELKREEESLSCLNQEFGKAFLNAKKLKAAYEEQLKIHQKEEAKEKKSVELITASINNIQQDINNISDYICNVCEEYEVAAREVTERNMEYTRNIVGMKDNFVNNCKELEQIVIKYQN